MVTIKYSGRYYSMLRSLIQKDEKITIIVESKILLFQKNPQDSRLQNHALTRRMRGKYAFRITDDIRIVYKWIGKQSVALLAIGSHKDVYRGDL